MHASRSAGRRRRRSRSSSSRSTTSPSDELASFARFRGSYHAKVIDRIAADHPKAIAVDIQFTEPTDDPTTTARCSTLSPTQATSCWRRPRRCQTARHESSAGTRRSRDVHARPASGLLPTDAGRRDPQGAPRDQRSEDACASSPSKWPSDAPVQHARLPGVDRLRRPGRDVHHVLVLARLQRPGPEGRVHRDKIVVIGPSAPVAPGHPRDAGRRADAGRRDPGECDRDGPPRPAAARAAPPR